MWLDLNKRYNMNKSICLMSIHDQLVFLIKFMKNMMFFEKNVKNLFFWYVYHYFFNWIDNSGLITYNYSIIMLCNHFLVVFLIPLKLPFSWKIKFQSAITRSILEISKIRLHHSICKDKYYTIRYQTQFFEISPPPPQFFSN